MASSEFNVKVKEKDKVIDELKSQNTNLSANLENINKKFTDLHQKYNKLLECYNGIKTKLETASRSRKLKGETRLNSTEISQKREINNASTSAGAKRKKNESCSSSDLEDEEMEEQNASHEANNITSTEIDIKNNKWSDIVMAGEIQKKTYISPIQIGKYNHDEYAKLINDLFINFNGTGYNWIQLKNGTLPRIAAVDAETKEKIMDFLKNNNWHFNTYAEKNQKQKAFIVRGFGYGNDEMNIRGIEEALKSAGFNQIIKIDRFLTGFQKRNPEIIHNKLYRVVLPNEVDDSNLAKIQTINSFRIKFEKMKNSKIVQCRRCQRYAHTARQCSFQYRCVQCIETHEPGKCPRMVNSRLPIACINCASEKLNHRSHTANDYQKCEFFKKFQNPNNSNSKKAGSKETAPKQTQPNFISQPVVETTARTKNPAKLSKKKQMQLIRKYRSGSTNVNKSGGSNSKGSQKCDSNNPKTNSNINVLLATLINQFQTIGSTLSKLSDGFC